jgi:hypothetical protein
MADETKKDEGPSCACGKVDLYDEWLKQNEKKEEVLIPASHADNQISSSDDAGYRDAKLVQTKK